MPSASSQRIAKRRKRKTRNIVDQTGSPPDWEKLEPVAGDVSPRRYYRGTDEAARPFVLMRYPDQTEKSRAELNSFIRIGEWLGSQGIKVPALYNLYETQNCATFEDLGQTSFGKALRAGHNPEELYTLACDVLIKLRDSVPPQGLPDYTQSRIYANRRQIIDYYYRLKKQRVPDEGTVQEYISVWDKIHQSLPPCPQGFLHADYHLENLIWVEREQGIRKCALIDYQDALRGPIPYDLLNLLEDARVDVPPELKQKILERYCGGMSAQEKETFLSWYTVLAAQFHGRVIGLFIKLSAEQGRDEYLIHISRLQNYLKKALENPILLPLKAWFEKEGLDFQLINDLNGAKIRGEFRN
ncbi:MAG: phosphotransferase [Alphaproteobacteria bacterium]|nr:phosphotransferase [Alphaproteobacteria bacterium]